MMSLRPEPVTSKFRRYYLEDILPIYHNPNLSYSNSSSAGSTLSLTSILNHESLRGDQNDLQYDSFDDISIDSNDLNLSKFPEESLKRLNTFDSNNVINEQTTKSKKQNGIFREIINLSKPIDCHKQTFKPLEKSCKRIIARKPDYPGSRVTQVNYKEVVCEKKSRPKLSKSTNNNHSNAISKFNENKLAEENLSEMKRIHRTTSRKKAENCEILENDVSNKTTLEKSNMNYSVCDFTSVSEDRLNPAKKSDEKTIDENNLSSVDDVNSITNDEGSINSEIVNSSKPSQRILTAWEDWYLRKEKQERKLLEKERRKMMNEEEKRKEQEIAKQKRREVCQKKINDWLKQKEDQRLKDLEKQKEVKKTKEKNELKKEDTMKKSSEKYVAWKLKKLEQQKEEERQEKERLEKIEAEKMIKKAKADVAFKHWVEEHKDHQSPVPYSYGISDGKLTSYYDKTSNPPPAYFNQKAWVPLIDTKQ